MASDSYDVNVYIYDLSKGMARAMSQAFLGKRIDGIWHTGVVVYGEEYFYGGTGGIECCPPGGTIMGQPDTIKKLGQTQIPKEMFLDYLRELSQTSYRPNCYHLLDHNCNTFSSEVAQFLTGNDIPSHITGLPAEVLSTPFGQMIRPMIDAMSVQPSGGHALFDDPPPPYTNHKPSSTATKQQTGPTSSPQCSAKTPQTDVPSSVNGITPFVFTEELPPLSFWISGERGLSTIDQAVIKEVYEYLRETDPSWSLGRSHLTTVVGLAANTDQGCGKEALGLLARLIKNGDVVQVLKHDPKSPFSKTLEKYEDFAITVKTSVVKMMCNCCATAEGRQFVIQENICKLTTRVCVSCLCDDDEALTSAGLALTHNLSSNKLNEDMELEIGSALLNCVGKHLEEQTVFHMLTAVHEISKRNNEVRGLASVLGIDVAQYRNKSDRVTALCDSIQTLLH